MGTRHPLGTAGFFLLVILLAIFAYDAASAQTRWPPWQSYGEAEKAARAKARRLAVPKQSEIDALNAQVAKLHKAGKTDEAIAVARKALNLTQRRHGRNHVATASALTTLAELLIEKKRYAEAEPLLKQALAIREQSKNSTEIALARHKLGELYELQGRTKEASAYLEREKREGGGVATKEDKQKLAAEAAKRKLEAEEKAARFEAERQASEKSMARAKAEAERAQAMAKKAIEQAEASRGGGAHPRKAAPKPRAYRRSPPVAAGEAAQPSAPSASTPSPSAPDSEMLARKSGGGAPAAMKEAPGRVTTMEAPASGGSGAAQPPIVGMLAKKDEKWDVVPVFFGTDRAEEANPKRLSYGSDRGHRLELGRALVTVPKSHQVPQIERPWAIRIPYFNVTIYEEAEDPNKHFTMQEIKKLSKEDLLKLVRERLASSARFKDQALVFVHGYNTSFDNAVYRTAQIAYDLKFDGAPFLYSWPSGGAVASYTYDRESAEASKPYMREFLDMVVKETGAKSVSIIAHSMGNQPLLDVLKDMKASAPEGVEISQIILAAPDVDADSFSHLAEAINGLAKGITLYAASNDRALMVSRSFWGHYRAGDVPAQGPLVLPGVDTIDVTAASTDVFALNHSEYAQNTKVLDDIGELIATGKRPPEDRSLHPERITTDHGDYWRYDLPTGSP